ncbi:MAG: hypothetical protein N3D80_09410, partial [Ignavibacterium album]
FYQKIFDWQMANRSFVHQKWFVTTRVAFNHSINQSSNHSILPAEGRHSSIQSNFLIGSHLAISDNYYNFFDFEK